MRIFMSKITPEKEIEEFFTRSVGNFIDPENSFKEKLLQKIKNLRLPLKALKLLAKS